MSEKKEVKVEKIKQFVSTLRDKKYSDSAIKNKLTELKIPVQIIDSVLNQGQTDREKKELLIEKVNKFVSVLRDKKYSDSAIKNKLTELKIPVQIIDSVLNQGQTDREKKELLIEKYVYEMKKRNISDEQIIRNLVAKSIPNEIIQKYLAKVTTTQDLVLPSPIQKTEYDRSKDTFTPDEFSKLEEKETSGLFKRRKKEKKEEEKKEESEEYNTYTVKQLSKELSRLQKAIEQENVSEGKFEGKIDMLNDKTKDMSIELETLGEKVGELRSTVIGRERMFNKLEDDFSTIKYVVNAFKPDVIEKRFTTLDAQLVQYESKIEKLEMQIKNNSEKVKEFLEIMKSIKNYQKLIEKLESLQKTQKLIDAARVEIEKMTGKMEIRFENVEESVARINEINNIAETNQSNVRDLIISLSKMEARLDGFIKKEDYEKVKSDVTLIKKVLYQKELTSK